MQLSNCEKRRIEIWEEMRRIEGELFFLSARSGELDFANRRRFQRLCGDRTSSQASCCSVSFVKTHASFGITIHIMRYNSPPVPQNKNSSNHSSRIVVTFHP